MSVTRSRYSEVKPYVTKDGSLIRELMHPDVHGNLNQSLAEAEIPAGGCTDLHVHKKTEEIYFISSGRGRMRLGTDTIEVEKGDTVLIRPGTPHCIENTGTGNLMILCCCSPPYSHDDTQLL